MINSPLQIGFGDYDRTRPLASGAVKISGVDAQFHSERIVTDVFRAMVQGKYDVAELGLTYFLRTMDLPDAPFLALPIFPNRCFRHSAIYVNVNSRIQKPQDLAGKTIGEFALYGHDAGVWPKGILSDEYGFNPAECKWVVGALDWPLEPIDFVPRAIPDGVSVKWMPEADLGEMLEAGQIDALISADVPRCYLERSTKVRRLFEHSVTTEQDYFRRTGIFPIMHTVAVRRDLAEKEPKALRAIYDAFCAAKKSVQDHYRKAEIFNNMDTMVPWLSTLLREDQSLLGEDWWPYGFAANRNAVETFCRYHYEQGLSKRRWACEEIFAPGLLET